jgi:hypothetical protein
MSSKKDNKKSSEKENNDSKKLLAAVLSFCVFWVASLFTYGVSYHRGLMQSVNEQEVVVAEVRGAKTERTDETDRGEDLKDKFKADLDFIEVSDTMALIEMELPYDTELLGFDLYIEVSDGLTFEEVECFEPFDCDVNYDTQSGVVSVYAMVPPQAMKTFDRGNLTMLELFYASDSTGTVSINSGSKKSVISRPYSDTNLLRQDTFVFEIAEGK